MPLDNRVVGGVISALWVVFFAYWTVRAFGNKRSVYRQSRRSRLFHLVIATGFIYPVLTIRQLRIPLQRTTAATQVTGIALCAAGIGVAIWGRGHVPGPPADGPDGDLPLPALR